MKILMTGTPGTGKTTIAKELAKKLKGFELIDLNKFAEDHACVSGIDKKRGSKIIDEKKLAKEIDKLKGDFIIEGHLAHFCKGDITFVLRCGIKELRRRLMEKGWKEEKIQENVDAEIMGIILEEAKKNGNPAEIDTSKGSKAAILAISKVLADRHIYKPDRKR